MFLFICCLAVLSSYRWFEDALSDGCVTLEEEEDLTGKIECHCYVDDPQIYIPLKTTQQGKFQYYPIRSKNFLQPNVKQKSEAILFILLHPYFI